MMVAKVFKEADRETSDLHPGMTRKLGLLTHMYYMPAHNPSDVLDYLWASDSLYRGYVTRRGDTVGQVITLNWKAKPDRRIHSLMMAYAFGVDVEMTVLQVNEAALTG